MKDFLSDTEEQELVDEIHAAETRTTGEIRIIVSKKWIFRLHHYAWKVFHRMGMTKTEARNGALIVVIPRRRRFVVIGDQSLNEKVEADYWNEVAEVMSAQFKDGNRTNALKSGINMIATTMAQHWPADGQNPDELPNEIVYD